MGKITQEVRPVLAKEPARSLFQRIFSRGKREAPIDGPGAQVIPFPTERTKGNEFKPQLGKGKGMVEEKISEEEELREKLRLLQQDLADLKERDGPGKDFVKRVIKSTKYEIEYTMKKLNGYAKEEVLEGLRERGAGFDRIEQLLEIPVERLFLSGMGYSEKREESSSYLGSDLRIQDFKPPKPEKTVFTIDFFDSSSQTYFILVDPYKKIIVMDQFSYLDKADWHNVSGSLKAALSRKAYLDQRGQKYGFIVSSMGHVQVF